MRPTAEDFLKDVAQHFIEVVRDDGVHRHIILRKPDSFHMRFELITWPGHLAYCGDMGAFVFARIDDMFNFFRAEPTTRDFDISPSYWAEKCIARDREGVKEYSSDKFRENIARWLDECEASLEVRNAVLEEVLPHADDGHQDAVRVATEFTHEGRAIFQDFWECNVEEYTFRFIWCCYAMQWAIKQYDKRKAERCVAQQQAHRYD